MCRKPLLPSLPPTLRLSRKIANVAYGERNSTARYTRTDQSVWVFINLRIILQLPLWGGIYRLNT